MLYLGSSRPGEESLYALEFEHHDDLLDYDFAAALRRQEAFRRWPTTGLPSVESVGRDRDFWSIGMSGSTSVMRPRRFMNVRANVI